MKSFILTLFQCLVKFVGFFCYFIIVHLRQKQSRVPISRKKNDNQEHNFDKTIHSINYSNQIHSTILQHFGFDLNMNLDRENYKIYLQSKHL